MSAQKFTPRQITVGFDGKWTVSYRVGSQESAFRVSPEMGHLIAAAPALYAVLERLREWCDENLNGSPPVYSELMLAADAALRAARGETP